MTITFNQARKLHELGVRKFAEESYYQPYGSEEYSLDIDPSHTLVTDQIYAYNAEELLGMLKGDLYMYRGESGWWWCGEEYNDPCEHGGATLTEALADKLIFDIENGIVTVEEVNK